MLKLAAQAVKNLPIMQETWVRSLGREGPLEEGMATHSSVLAWRSPWTEEPGGLSPWGCKESYMTEQPTYILYSYIYVCIYIYINTCIYNPTVQTHYTDMQITEYRQYAKSISVLKITLNFRYKHTKIIQMYWILSLLLSYCIACLIDS